MAVPREGAFGFSALRARAFVFDQETFAFVATSELKFAPSSSD
jgi:hypothetical protein